MISSYIKKNIFSQLIDDFSFVCLSKFTIEMLWEETLLAELGCFYTYNRKKTVCSFSAKPKRDQSVEQYG